MDDIDYEALAKATGVPYDVDATFLENMMAVARAVVAAYQKQMRERGVVEVRRELLDIARGEMDSHESIHGGSVFWREVDELDAILDAPGDDTEGPNE